MRIDNTYKYTVDSLKDTVANLAFVRQICTQPVFQLLEYAIPPPLSVRHKKSGSSGAATFTQSLLLG